MICSPAGHSRTFSDVIIILRIYKIKFSEDRRMYPKTIILGMGLYEIFIIIGVIYAMALFRIISDKDKLDARLQNTVIIGALVSIIGGYGSAVFFQAVYNYFESGIFEISKNTGATFYGGFIGGAVIFLTFYFVCGYFCFSGNSENNGLKNYHLKHFVRVTDIAAAAVAGAHGFGRIGCLMAGCCYGRVTDSWIGVWNSYLGEKTVPVQLFEAIFLLALSTFLIFRCVRGKTYGLPIYLVSYGVWRFFIEYLRADDRGATSIGFLSPSQLTAIILAAVGIGAYILNRKVLIPKWSEDRS